MVEGKKNDEVGNPISLFLEQVRTRQRDEMMENFSHILQRLPIATGAYSSSGHFGGMLSFKVQVNFDIHVFEGQIDEEALDKWLNLLEGYFSVHKFSTKKISPSHSLKLSPMSNIGGKLIGSKIPQRSLKYMESIPLGIFLWMW
jgi:hypothetical protein